eukprot:scaffold22106_cov64-Attheya_sp.AAC.3
MVGWRALFSVLVASIVICAESIERRGVTKHIHLAVGHDPSTSMTISFSSVPSASDPQPKGLVFLGTSPDEMTRTVPEVNPALRYNTTMVRGKYEYISDNIHHITVFNLEPDTKYYYKCATIANPKADKQAISLRRNLEHVEYNHVKRNNPREPVFSFVTAPRPGDTLSKTGRVKFAVIGDLGQNEASIRTMNNLHRDMEDISAILLAGDIAYTQYNHRSWDTWFDLMDDYPVISQKPLQIAAGNHDLDMDMVTGDIFFCYEERFRMPQFKKAEIIPVRDPGPLSMAKVPYPYDYEYGNSYYSFTYGPSFHIVINSYASMEPDSKQYAFVKNSLSSVDRSVTPWVFVMMHVPIYNTFLFHQRDKQRIAALTHMEPLFVKYNVNLVLTGHVHAYLRTKNVAFGKLDKKGPVHIIVGDAGHQAWAPFLNPTPEEWVAMRDGSIFGYGTIEIYNNTHLKWDWVQTGTESDHNVHCIRKNSGCVELPPGGEDQFFLENQYFL